MKKLALQGTHAPVLLDRVILGTNRYGGAKTEQQSFEQLDLFVDQLGGTTLDTATVYGETTPGISKSELVIGKWLRGRNRQDIKIISKGCCYKLNAPHQPRVTPEALRQDLYQSLEALVTDYVDVFLLHRDDPAIPVGEMIDALDAFVSQGLIRAAGVSNWWMNRILEGNAYARAHGRARLAVSEIQWSYAPQTIGQEVLKEEHNAWMTDGEFAAYKAANVPVLAYFAQARGYIPKYLDGADMQSAAKEFDNAISRARARRIDAMVKETGYTPTQLSLAYLLHSGIESAVLVGASSEEQLRDSCACVHVSLSEEQLSYLRGNETIG